MCAQLRPALAAFALLLGLAALPPAAPAQAPSGGAALDPESRAWLARQFAAYDARSTVAPQGAPTPLARSLATWDWLRRPAPAGAEPPLALQAEFIAGHAGWPGLAAMRRRAEAQAADLAKTSDSEARAFFMSLPPQSAAGQARFALLSSGAEAERLARTAWVRSGIPPELESALLSRFGSILTRADHARRADALLWAGQTTAAGRLLPLLDDEARALAAARLALRTNAPDAEARVASVPARFRRDIGLTHDRVLWLERRGRLAEAEALMAAGDTEAGASAPDSWLEKRLAMGRVAMRRGDHGLAQRILANHRAFVSGTDLAALPLSTRVRLSDTEWLAGWIALRKRSQPADAVRHFETFNRVVLTPISQSRGDYWLGRAERARGREAEARAAFERAARHFDYFYGQLAAEELGRLPELPLVPRIQPTTAERAAFEATPLARAVLTLNAMGSRERESLFVRALAESARTPTEARIAAELGRRIGRDDLAVWAWKEARPRGDLSTFDLAFPRMAPDAPVPAGQWIIAHAIARQESSFDRTALSSAGARGLMQLMPATAADVARRLGLPYSPDRLFTDPAFNITLGSDYIALRRSNFGNAALAIAAYNAGAGNVRRWIAQNGDPRAGEDMVDWVEMIPIQETRNYVHRVVENAVVYSLLEPRRPDASPRASRWLMGP